MFLYEGRTVYFKGDKVIVLEKINAKLVKVAKKSNPRMIFFQSEKSFSLCGLLLWKIGF